MGSDIDAQDREGRTALHIAILSAHNPVVQILKHKGANTKLVDDEGRSALHQAAIQGNVGILRLLAEEGTDLTRKIMTTTRC